MGRAGAGVLLLLLGACASSRRLPETVRLSIGGASQAWKAAAVEGGDHIHSGGATACEILVRDVAGAAPPDKAEAFRAAVSNMNAALEDLTVQVLGPAYGGPDRCLIRLARFPEGSGVEDAVVLMEIPRLPEGSAEAVFSPPQLRAGHHAPSREASAPLESGTVRVRRTSDARLEVEAELRFRRPEGPYDVKGRFEAPIMEPGRARP